jgi:hypothetical protein
MNTGRAVNCGQMRDLKDTRPDEMHNIPHFAAIGN